MSEEKNQLNVYNHIETIKEALAQIETIHVYELANRQYGTSEEEELRNRNAELEVYNKDLNKQWGCMFDNYNKLVDEYRSATVQIEKLTETLKTAEDKVVTYVATQDKVNKLPRIVKKFYGLK